MGLCRAGQPGVWREPRETGPGPKGVDSAEQPDFWPDFREVCAFGLGMALGALRERGPYRQGAPQSNKTSKITGNGIKAVFR
jgi:hypothetical protein